MIGRTYNKAFSRFIESLKHEDLQGVEILSHLQDSIGYPEDSMLSLYGRKTWREYKSKLRSLGYIDKKNGVYILTLKGKEYIEEFQLKYWDNHKYFFEFTNTEYGD